MLQEGHGLEEAPIVRMFGVNKAGNSVCVFVHGFEPYFYVEAPTPTFGPDDCTNLQEVLNVALGARYVLHTCIVGELSVARGC